MTTTLQREMTSATPTHYPSIVPIFPRGVRKARMPRAVWNGVVIAECDDCEIVEGNRYFPAGAVKREHLRPSDTHTVCSWKGTANYYDVVVGAAINRDAAWYYPDPKPAAEAIRGRIAFWKGVRVEDAKREP
jgi:uncharacterized protein (DUF427 family)